MIDDSLIFSMDLISMPEQTLTLTQVRHEYDDVSTYFFTVDTPIPYVPGQYAHVRLFGMASEDKAVREFSFASAPHESLIAFGIDARSGSPYQKRLQAMRAGDTAGIFKIKSHMTWPPHVHDVVMIAGGVGVTPFRSQLLDLKEKQMDIRSTLIHASHGPHLYGDELSSLTEYIATERAELSKALQGVMAAQKDAHYYLAGSPQFVAAVSEELSMHDIARIETDAFKGLLD